MILWPTPPPHLRAFMLAFAAALFWILILVTCVKHEHTTDGTDRASRAATLHRAASPAR